MRDVRFRAWDKKRKVMHIVWRIDFSDEFDEPFSHEEVQVHYEHEWLCLEKEEYILIEYTGLKDKNGKDLDWWKDDLFMLNGYLRQIIFTDGCFMFLTIFNNNQMLCKDVLDWAELPQKVGNIHQHPKLLEQHGK